MLSGTSRARSRSALQVPVHLAQCPLLLSLAVWSSVLSLSPQYLCHQQPLLSLLGWAEVRDTQKKMLGNKRKSPLQLSGNQLWVTAQSPLWDSQRILFTSWPSAELQSEDSHKHVLPNLHLDQRPSVKPQTKDKWPDKTRPLLRVLGRGHNSQPLLPSQKKGLGEPTLALWGHPTYTPAGRDLTSQREALMTWGGDLCVSGPGRDFKLLLSMLRGLGRWGPVLPTCGPRGGKHRGQGCWDLAGCAVLIRGDLCRLHSLVLVSLSSRDIPHFS